MSNMDKSENSINIEKLQIPEELTKKKDPSILDSKEQSKEETKEESKEETKEETKITKEETKITKEKNQDILELKLGQFIEIEASGNDDLDGKTFYVNYLDEKIISLINDIDDTRRELFINNNRLTDESIKTINIVYSQEEDGYARQNGLTTGKWFTIEFGGEIPTIVNGEITNLENDMIEFSLYPSNEKIYIDFGYKGIPKNLPIIEIRPFERPAVKSFIDDIEKENTGIELSKELQNLEKSQSEQSSMEFAVDEDDYDDLNLNFIEDEQKDELHKIIIDANSIILVEDEAIEYVDEYSEVEIERRVYPINFQVNDMLDALLADYPTIERNTLVLDNIHTIINRFKELRLKFSDFSKDGSINSLKKSKKNFKPIVDSLLRLENDLYWLIPIVRNRKKLYDLTLLEDSVDEDVFLEDTGKYINNYSEILKSYMKNAVPDDSKKYAYIQQQINNIQTVSSAPSNRTNLINKIKINTDLHSIIDNLDDFNSSSVNNDDLGRKKYSLQKNITGEHMLYKNPLIKRKIYEKKQIIQNEEIYLKGFLMMSKYFIELTKLKLKESNMYKKVLLHNNFKFHEKLQNRELIKYIIDEDFEDLSYKTNFLKEPSEISFVETRNYSERNNDEIYENFLDKMIPTTEKIIQNIGGYLKNTTNNVTFLKELEPFLIYYENLTFPQYKLMNDLIESNITKYKQTLSGRLLELNKGEIANVTLPNILEKIFSANDTFGQTSGDNEAYLAVLRADEEVRQAEAKEGEEASVKEGEKITKKILNINTTLKELYGFEGKPMSNTDILREIYTLDGGDLMNTYIGLLQIDMRESLNLQEKLEKEIEYADDKIGSEKLPENNCKNFVLTKTYTDIELLKEDNNKEFIFYDRKYDNTPYDILNEFLKEKRDLSDEEFKQLLVEHLIKNVGVIPKMAERDAESMVIGQKRIINEEYAVLDMGDYEYRYYQRINNEWRLQDEYNDKMPDDSMFCNVKDKCLTINNNCADENQNTIKIHNKLVNDIINNFSKELEKSYEQISKELKKKQKLQTIYLQEKVQFDKRDMLNKNNLMMKLAQNIAQEELKISPYSKLLTKILSQKNIVKKNNDIILFYEKYCRPYEKTNGNENEYWYYCLDTNYPLMPTFLLTLAESYKDNSYQKTLDKIAKERGSLSDDGDKLVDKHSGYVIKYIEYDVTEGYNAEGYKIKSRDLLKDDDGDIIIKTVTREKSHKTKLEKVVYSILKNLDKSVGIDMSLSYEFVFENTFNILKNIIPEKKYKKLQKKAEKMNKRMKSYNMIVNENIIFSIMALYIIVVQTSIPPVQTSKTFPGCKRNFSGYPLDESTSNNGLIEYIVCVCLKIKNDSRPWVALPKIKQNKDKKSNEKLEKFIVKFKKFLIDKVLSIYEVNTKLELKREWLKNNFEELTMSEEFNVRRWTTFLPPLNKINIDNVKMLGNSIRLKLDATIRKNKSEQFIIMNKIIGKIKELSMYIISNINKVVKRKDKLFVTNNGLPYIENACCNDKSINTYRYFVEEEGIIDRDVNNVLELSKMIKRVKNLNKAKLMFSEKNTKTSQNKISNNFSEETIYMAFIKYCKYNTGLALEPELQTLCIKNSSNFTNGNTIQEKIAIIKNENGDIYNEKSMELLMKYIHRKNMVDITINKEIVNNTVKFKKLLEYIQGKNNVKICNKEIIPKILNLVDKYATQYKKRDINEKDDLLLFIDEDVQLQLNNISTFFKKNLRRGHSKIMKYLLNFINYEVKGTGLYMSNNDETGYLIGSQIQTMIANMCSLYPNIILEKVSYKMYVPEHWKLSERHVQDIEKFVFDEHSSLNEFYDDNNMIKLLTFVQNNTVDLLNIVKNIPFYSDFKNNTDINNNIYIKMHKYFFICSISLYIKLMNEMLVKTSLEGLEEMKSSGGSVEEVIMNSSSNNLERNVANLLKEFINIFIKHKKFVNLSNNNIEGNILKAKEKEKDSIRLNLKNLTVESRNIENIMKNHKLGRWSFGESKAVFEYDADQYDKERGYIENVALMEKRAGIKDDVTNANMEILQMDGDMLDYLEEDIINQREMLEVNMLDNREDGEADGEEMW